MADDDNSVEADKVKKSPELDELEDAASGEDSSADVETDPQDIPDEGNSVVEAVPGDDAEDAVELPDGEVADDDDGAAVVEAVPEADEELIEEDDLEDDPDGEAIEDEEYLNDDELVEDEEALDEEEVTYDPTPFEDPAPPRDGGFAAAAVGPGPAAGGAAAAMAGAAPQVTQTIVKKAGFVPLVLGGAAAAIIGFAAARYVVPEGWPFPGVQTEEDPFVVDTLATLEAHGAALAELDARTTAVEQSVSGIDAEALMAQSGEAAAAAKDAGERLEGLSANLDALDERLTALEKRPVEESVSPEAIQAYERELEAMGAAMQEQRAEIEAMVAEATAKEDTAKETAQLSQARAALAQISSALTEGKPFADAAAQLQQATGSVPQALANVANEGVATQSDLSDAFPGASRAALSAARDAGASEEGGGKLTSFLREQLGARSVVPREGDDVDAVLSRVDAAQRAGDLDTALAEIEALPEPAQEALSVWTAQAQARRDALAALSAASQELNTQ